jgi:hypothetical protein
MTKIPTSLNNELSEEFINFILKAKREIKDGEALTGNLDKLAEEFEKPSAAQGP